MMARDRNSVEYPKPKEDVYVLWVEGISQQYRWQEFKDRVRECRPKPDKISVRQSAVHEPNPGCGQVTIPNKEQALFAYEHLCTHGWNRQNIKVSLFGVRGGEVEKPKLLRGPEQCGPGPRGMNNSVTSTPGRAAMPAFSSVSSSNPRSAMRPSYPAVDTTIYPTQIAYTTAPFVSPIEAQAPIYPLTNSISPAAYNPILPSPTSTAYPVQYQPQYTLSTISQPAPTLSPPQEPRLARTVFLSNVPKGATFQSIKDYIRSCVRNASIPIHIEGVDMHGSKGHVSVIVGSREQGDLVVHLVAGKRWGNKVIQARFERERIVRGRPTTDRPANTRDTGGRAPKNRPEQDRGQGMPLIVDGSRGIGGGSKGDEDDEDDEAHESNSEVEPEKEVEAATRAMSKATVTRKGRR